MDCLLSTSSDDETLENKEKLYNPKQLNNLLLNETKNTAKKYHRVSIIGDITDFRKWKRSGCGFKLTLNKESIECKVWEKDGLTVDEVEKYMNTQCIITGVIEACYYYGHKFVVNVLSIKIDNEDTKLNKLKSICEKEGYFENKKVIDWNNIYTIGIISKMNTQGRDDFHSQFLVPISIKFSQITLEGPKTYKECIKSIKELQDCDLILIMRGGGDTGEISNSYDVPELFKCIKNSSVPIVTAIGHEQDKGDKLLITNVSDLDFPTPTALAKDLTQILYRPIYDKIGDMLQTNQENFDNIIEKDTDILYNNLTLFLEKFIKSKFGGRIVEIDDEEDHIIIHKNGKYYFNQLVFDKELDLKASDLQYKDTLNRALVARDINAIHKLFTSLNGPTFVLTDSILDCTKKIKKIETLRDKFINSEPKVFKKYYLKKNKYSGDTKEYIKIRANIFWYKKIVDDVCCGRKHEEIVSIYDFIKNLTREEVN